MGILMPFKSNQVRRLARVVKKRPRINDRTIAFEKVLHRATETPPNYGFRHRVPTMLDSAAYSRNSELLARYPEKEKVCRISSLPKSAEDLAMSNSRKSRLESEVFASTSKS